MNDDTNVLVAYTLEEALADGVLVEVFKPRRKQLTSDKPIVATAAVFDAFTLAALMEIGTHMWFGARR